MAITQAHIIKKFTLDISTTGIGEQYKQQRRFSDLLQQKVLPAMDGIFTSYFPADAVTRINKIELDLGDIDASELDKVFADECLKQLISSIKNLTANTTAGNEDIVQSVTTSQNYIEQFFYFLQTGKLPWSVIKNNSKDWEQHIITSIREYSNLFTGQFQQLIQQHNSAAERLVAQFDFPFINEMFAATGIVSEKEVEQLFKNLQSVIKKCQSNLAIKPLFISIIKILSSIEVKYWRAFFSVLLAAIESAAGSTGIKFENIKNWEDHIRQLINQDIFLQKEECFKTETQDLLAVKNKKDQSAKEEKEQGKQLDKNDAVFIDNAGLVILHPFIAALFEILGFTVNQTFINKERRHRAAHLLQYIINRQAETPEYLMPLNKLLCGIADDDHIDRFVQLTQIEKDEADKLLLAVIGHWTVLKNTSVEGLQETFLQRKAKLYFNKAAGHWQLQVERTGIDVLLEKIPWGFTYVKLPWMQHAISTEW